MKLVSLDTVEIVADVCALVHSSITKTLAVYLLREYLNFYDRLEGSFDHIYEDLSFLSFENPLTTKELHITELHS